MQTRWNTPKECSGKGGKTSRLKNTLALSKG
jgi:hypothetical protein